MKTIFTFLLITLSSYLIAQNQPLITGVETFGNWTSNSGGELPQYWDGFNREIIINGMPVGTVTTVRKDSADPQDSDYSVQLTSSSVMGGPAVPGMLTTGKMHINFNSQNGDIDGGIPYQAKPAKLKGWYKYNPAMGDTALISIWFKNDTMAIGGGTLKISQSTSLWTAFELDITYSSNLIPDTMNILFSTSTKRNNVPLGSVLDIDHIWLEGGNVGYERPIYAHDDFKLYPNPSSDFIKIESKERFEELRIRILNNLGAVVYESNHYQKNQKIQTRFFKSGIYFVEIGSETSKSIKKLIIQ